LTSNGQCHCIPLRKLPRSSPIYVVVMEFERVELPHTLVKKGVFFKGKTCGVCRKLSALSDRKVTIYKFIS